MGTCFSRGALRRNRMLFLPDAVCMKDQFRPHHFASLRVCCQDEQRFACKSLCWLRSVPLVGLSLCHFFLLPSFAVGWAVAVEAMCVVQLAQELPDEVWAGVA